MEPDHNTEPAGLPSESYCQLLPALPSRFLPYQADINRVVTVKVTAFEEGYNGECVIAYGPILVDEGVQKRLGEAIKINYLEVDCDGGSKRSTFRFDLLKIDNYEVQCYDKHHGKLVDTVRITNDLATDPSMIDSLQMRMITTGNGTGLN